GLGGQFDPGGLPNLLPLTADRRDMAAFRFSREPAGLILEAELHGGITIPVRSADLQHHARARLDHGDRDARSGLVEDLRHADFATQKSFSHLHSIPAGDSNSNDEATAAKPR